MLSAVSSREGAHAGERTRKAKRAAARWKEPGRPRYIRQNQYFGVFSVNEDG